MIGLDFPVKPEWIYDVHMLWQPEQPVGDLVQACLERTMQELGGEKTRRNSLSIILRLYVETAGHGSSRQTVSRDVWVEFSRAYPVSTMAPAYLAQLVAQNEVAQAACEYITQRYSPGDTLVSTDLRQHVIRHFGERKVITNAASAFLRSLAGFGVLTEGERRGQFLWAKRLSVPREVFPLIVWAWWQKHLSPQIDLGRFEDDPAVAFLEQDGFASHWRVYQPTLWVLEERLEGRRATLKYVESTTLEQALLDIL